MQDVLIPEDELSGMDMRLDDILSVDDSIHWQIWDPALTSAYARFLLFSNTLLRQASRWSILSESDAFYNAYYWFATFAERYQLKFGADVGVEQQVFQFLEMAPSEVDWKIVAQIVEMAKS